MNAASREAQVGLRWSRVGLLKFPQQRLHLCHAGSAHLPAHGQRLLEQGQALFFLAELAEQTAEITGDVEQAFGVVGFLRQLQGLSEGLQGLLKLLILQMNVSHVVQSGDHAHPVAEFSANRQTLFQIRQRLAVIPARSEDGGIIDNLFLCVKSQVFNPLEVFSIQRQKL